MATVGIEHKVPAPFLKQPHKMPRNNRHRLNYKGNKKHKQKISNQSEVTANDSISSVDNNPVQDESVDTTAKDINPTTTTVVTQQLTPTGKQKTTVAVATGNGGKKQSSPVIAAVHYDCNKILKDNRNTVDHASNKHDLKKQQHKTQTNVKNKRNRHKSLKPVQKNEIQPIVEPATNNVSLPPQILITVYQHTHEEESQIKIHSPQMSKTSLSIHRGLASNQQCLQLSTLSSTATTPIMKRAANELAKTPNENKLYAICTPYSKKRPLNGSDDSLSNVEQSKVNVTHSITPSWSTTITSQAKRARGIHHQSDFPIPKRLFHDELTTASTPITTHDQGKFQKCPMLLQGQNIIIGAGDDGRRSCIREDTLTTSVITQTIEKSNKITFTNMSTNSTTEIFNEELSVSTKITTPLNFSKNCQKTRQSMFVPNNFSTNFQSKCSSKFSWLDSITNIFSNFGTNLKKKWAMITLKRQTSSLASPHQQINNATTHAHHMAIEHADCYAQLQIMQRTIHDLVVEHEEQNKKIESITNEMMQLKQQLKSATSLSGLMFGTTTGNCNNCGFSIAPSVAAPPLPPPPPPPLPPFSLIPQPMQNNACLREKKTGSRQLQRAALGTERPTISLKEILSVKLKKTNVTKPSEPEPKINNVNILSRSQLKQVRIRTKSRARSRGGSPAQRFFDNCKTGTKSLLELLEDSGRNIQVQNRLKTNQNLSLN